MCTLIRLRLLVAGCLIHLFAGAGLGQVSSLYGALLVTVVDITGAPIPGCPVTATLPERNWDRTASTSATGSVHFAALPPGEYSVCAAADGFDPQQARVAILLGHEGVLRFELRPAAQRHEVTVTAESDGVDSYTIPLHTHVSPAQIAQLPINQRNFLGFVLLDSGLQRDALRVHAVASTSGFNVMGQRPRNNSLQLDGADLNDESTGGVRGSVPMEAVQEFQSLASGYQAEYGRASGGVVNVVTKSGGNEFHGSAFGFVRHRSLDATNAFSLMVDPPYTRTQYGASLSGPLQVNRTFFFAAFEQLRRQESGFSRAGADAGLLGLTPQQEALAALQPSHPAIRAAVRGSAIAQTGIDPETNAPPSYHVTPLPRLSGVYPIRQGTGTYMIRLDHEIASSHHASVRLNYAHDKLSALEAQNNDQIAGLLAPERTAALITLDPTIVLTLNSLLNPRALNDFRLSWSQRKFDMTPNSLAAPVNISGVAFLGRENILPHYRTEKHFHVDDIFMLSTGAHTLKLGGDLMLCPAEVEYHRFTNGLFTFGPQPAPGAAGGSPALTPAQAYGLGMAASFVQQFGGPYARAGKTSGGVFLQDSWRASPRFTMDFGLRYDIERAKRLSPGSPAMREIFSVLGLRRSPPLDANNVQPRVGFAYQALPDGRFTVRGSYGLFYDRLLNLATYLAAVGDGSQMTRVILTGAAATDVFQSAAQKLLSYPGSAPPTGVIAFSRDWELGGTQQSNLVLSSQIRKDLTLDAAYVWVKGTQLPRSRDVNPADSARAAASLAGGNTLSDLLHANYFRPFPGVSEAMAFEGGASSTYHGFRLSLRGRVSSALTIHSSYTLSKAIDDAEEIFPHTRAQNMKDLRAERGLALFDQRQRFMASAIYEFPGRSPGAATFFRLLSGLAVSPIFEAGSGRPVNVLLGFDNNLDQDPGSDRPHAVSPGVPGAVATRYGWFAAPPAGMSGNLGRNAFIGPGFASVSLRVQKASRLTEKLVLDFIAEAFNLFNRTNVRAVNPNYRRAGEAVSADDPRQIQLGLRLRF